jgi:hypothetical protein
VRWTLSFPRTGCALLRNTILPLDDGLAPETTKQMLDQLSKRSRGEQGLNSDGGSIGGPGYAFAPIRGLNVSSALSNVAEYSRLIDFSFQTLSGYRKIVDYKDGASDNGVYNLNTGLNYFNSAFGPNGALTGDTLARLIVTRDSATNLITRYRFHQRCHVHRHERNYPLL